MPRTRPPYPPAFRAEAVQLIRFGRKPLSEIAKETGVSDQTLRNLVRQEQVDDLTARSLAPSRRRSPHLPRVTRGSRCSVSTTAPSELTMHQPLRLLPYRSKRTGPWYASARRPVNGSADGGCARVLHE